MLTSKLYDNNQIIVPSKILKKHNLKPGSIVEWIEDNNDEIKIRFREKSELRDIVGILNTKDLIDAVKLKKMSKDEIKKIK